MKMETEGLINEKKNTRREGERENKRDERREGGRERVCM